MVIVVIKELVDYGMGYLNGMLQEQMLKLFQFFMNLINNSLWDFWNKAIVVNLLNTATLLSILSMVIGVVFLLNDIAEQIEQIDIKIILFSLAKGFIFAVSARWIVQSLFFAANIFVTALNVELDQTALMNFIKGDTLLGPGFTVWLFLILIIALAVFFFMQLGRFAAMLIHILSAFAYVPFIICGDTQKMKEWISMALSIALTYCIQYICFYSGLSLMVAGNLITGGVFIIASFIVAKELKHLGHSTGTANTLRGSASMAYQAFSGIKAMGAI